MKLKKATYLAGLFLLILATQLNAQNINVSGVFPTIDHSGDLSNKFEYSLYYFAAFPLINIDTGNSDAYFNLFYSEQAVTYKVTTKFSLTGSYVYQRANVVYDNYVNENRFYVQAKYKHAAGTISLTHRLRLDGRFVHDRLRNTTPFTHRARYLLGVETPISTSLYFSAYEEAFFNTFENPGAVFAENWAYAAVGKKLNAKNKLELGVLYITWNIGAKNWFNQYYLQATWISHLDFRKTKP